MCCCAKPNINGQPGYQWQPNDAPMTHLVHPPDLGERDELLSDEPGRCGGIDSHSHHYRLVKTSGTIDLLVRHGGGQERFRLSCPPALRQTLAAMDTNARYWMLNAIYQAHSDSALDAREATSQAWRTAAVEGRLKTRKKRGAGIVRVWIEPPAEAA